MVATCKLGTRGCWNDGKCRATSNCMEKIITNGDKIRSMSDTELARWICKGAHYSDSACSYCRHNKEKTCTGQECQNKSDEDIIREWLMEVAED